MIIEEDHYYTWRKEAGGSTKGCCYEVDSEGAMNYLYSQKKKDPSVYSARTWTHKRSKRNSKRKYFVSVIFYADKNNTQ